MNSAYAVELKGVVKRYNEILAVNQVDLTINTGEIFGLLGPNGSGKSTTMKMLLGLVKPDAGVVTVLGTDVQRDPVGMKQKIALIAAFLHRPKLLIMDEPLNALDPRSARIVKDFLQELKAQGVTTIISTQDRKSTRLNSSH